VNLRLIAVRGKRGSGLHCWRRDAVKGWRWTSHWHPLTASAYGNGGTPITGNASEVSIGYAAFLLRLYAVHPCSFSPLLKKKFYDRSLTCRFDTATLGIDCEVQSSCVGCPS